jgi:hypothetical protein
MKPLKYLVLIFFAGSIMFACNNEKKDLQVNLYELLENRGAFFDTTISKKQKQAYKKLLEVIVTNLKFQDDRIVFMDKDKFLSKGFTETLYGQFTQDIESANTAIAKDSLLLNVFREKFPAQMVKLKEKIDNW